MVGLPARGKSYTRWAWRVLGEIDGGICDSMSHVQIQERLPEQYAARKRDKFTYRYPRGESYQDIILRLDPVIIELERTRKPVLVIADNAVLRARSTHTSRASRASAARTWPFRCTP
ncbi:MAG TPA: histidine phosphatase family protein [Methylomirabilota bacterium]|nr:histidine phosphatase family protein [Methylomirabilota bacterium]